MIYKFKSAAAADVIMMGPNGEQLLRLMGREPAAQGIVTQSQLGAAISALEQAVAEDEAEFARLQIEAQAAGEPAPKREGISLRQRAWPLLEMMRLSLVERQDVVWGA
ncbi:DUF1840 domain-containing protein [Paucibacter sp. PLA-PC-4]|uniref:DUF1840 domain-containing protein n=1 Tax=Paucibacter sp. PLA-PC-4 TaxID=2993655 RepID=UPI00224AEF6E|nr:DUF1840 domain-containing protein [Paucibacter sp. PLA-PC-4]MCX2864760.1 DUF1840 domain-containing protein [Paucibacter sp. PLA-PC-4]